MDNQPCHLQVNYQLARFILFRNIPQSLESGVWLQLGCKGVVQRKELNGQEIWRTHVPFHPVNACIQSCCEGRSWQMVCGPTVNVVSIFPNVMMDWFLKHHFFLTNKTDLVEMFHISRSLAVVVAGTALQSSKPESQTIADVWARSIVSWKFSCWCQLLFFKNFSKA